MWQNRAENLFEINVLLSNLEQSDKPNPLGRTEIDPSIELNHDADCCVNPRTHRTILEVSGSDGDESVCREE